MASLAALACGMQEFRVSAVKTATVTAGRATRSAHYNCIQNDNATASPGPRFVNGRMFPVGHESTQYMADFQESSRLSS